MLPKKFRLTVAQFNQIPQRSLEYKTDFVNFRIKKQTGSCPRFAVIVPKALDKRSSKRHLTKRVILETIYKESKNSNLPLSVLIRAQKIINKQNKHHIKEEIKYLLTKAKQS